MKDLKITIGDTERTFYKVVYRYKVKFKGINLIVYATKCDTPFETENDLDFYEDPMQTGEEKEISYKDLETMLGEEDYDYFMDHLQEMLKI